MMNDFIWGITLCEVPEEYKEGDIGRIKEAGCGWVRLHFSWRHIEKEKGIFDFSFYDSLIDKIRAEGLKILAAVGCGYTSMLPDWIIKENEESLNLMSYIPQLSRFVDEVVEHFKGRVEIWQAENEINHTSFHVMNGWRKKGWVLNPVGELSVLIGIISVIKANDPSGRVMINLECDNPNWYPLLKLLIKKSLPFDIIGIDFYPCYSLAFSPEDSIYSRPDRILSLAEIIRKASGFKKEIIVAETGYPCSKGLYSKTNQAYYIHYACQTTKALGASGIFIWELSDQHSKGPEFPEYYFGLYATNREPKPSISAYKEEIKRSHQRILILSQGLLFRESKWFIKVYINGKFSGKTNTNGMFISEGLSVGKYKIGVKGFLPWQRASKDIILESIPQYIQIFI